MERIFLYGLHAAATAVLWMAALVALMALMVGARRVRAGWGARAALTRTVGEALLVMILVAIIGLTLMPTGTSRHLELVPFAHIRDHLANGMPALNDFIGGNVVLFMPFGLLLAWRLGAAGTVLRVTLLGAAVSTTVEILQYVLAIGRQTLIDDVILNTLGTALGAMAWRAVAALGGRWSRAAREARQRPPSRSMPDASHSG